MKVIGLLSCIALVACTSRSDPAADTSEQDSDSMSATVMMAQLPPGAMRGAQIWADNCVRCHNIRSPRSLSDRQWEIVMMHMRVRGGLTGEEQEQVLTFLQAAN